MKKKAKRRKPLILFALWNYDSCWGVFYYRYMAKAEAITIIGDAQRAAELFKEGSLSISKVLIKEL